MCPAQAGHMCMLDTQKTHVFDPYHDPKRWAITDEERERQRAKVSCPKLLQQENGQAEGQKCIQILQKDAPIPEIVSLALQTRRK